MRVGSAFYTCTSNRTTGSALREMRVGSAFYTCTSGWKCILYLHFQKNHWKCTSRNEGRKCILYLHFLLGSAFYTCTSIWKCKEVQRSARKCKEVQRSAFSTQPAFPNSWIYSLGISKKILWNFDNISDFYFFEKHFESGSNCTEYRIILSRV